MLATAISSLSASIAGLSLLGTDGVQPIDAAHALPEVVMRRVRARQPPAPQPPAQREGARAAQPPPAVGPGAAMTFLRAAEQRAADVASLRLA